MIKHPSVTETVRTSRTERAGQKKATDRSGEPLVFLTAILSAIVEMSDDVKQAATPLDQFGKMLRLHNSIQKNRKRLIEHMQIATEAMELARPDRALRNNAP